MNAIFTPYSDLLQSLNGLPPPKIQSKQLEKVEILSSPNKKLICEFISEVNVLIEKDNFRSANKKSFRK